MLDPVLLEELEDDLRKHLDLAAAGGEGSRELVLPGLSDVRRRGSPASRLGSDQDGGE
jgi:hypothetical protein